MPVEVVFEDVRRRVAIAALPEGSTDPRPPRTRGVRGQPCAPSSRYLKWLPRRSDELPIDGIVLTEHRQFDPDSDYRPLEDAYGIRILRGAEVETDYGHVLVYGVNRDILARFDFTNVRLNAQELVTEVERLGGIAAPCHPGRPTVGLCEHYETSRRSRACAPSRP